jgi:carbamoyltransferase
MEQIEKSLQVRDSLHSEDIGLRVKNKDRLNPWILGISASHNGGACLLRGDEIFVAVQEERLLRFKRAEHPASKVSLAIQYCLEYAAIRPEDLSCVVLATCSSENTTDLDLTLNPLLRTTKNSIYTYNIGHHLAHAIGAFATSGFRESAILVIDSSGSHWADLSDQERRVVNQRQYQKVVGANRGPVVETISIYSARDTMIEPLEKHVSHKDLRSRKGMRYFWSLGFMYEAVAEQIFGNGLSSAGKVMGLAPFGYANIPASDFFEIVDGEFCFNNRVPERFSYDGKWPLYQDEYQNLAASVQDALEQAVLYLGARARAICTSSRLCYAGGVALNSVANEKLIRHSGFEHTFIMPAAEDSGTAIGAAYYGLWKLTSTNKGRKLFQDSVGRRYSQTEIEASIAISPGVQIIKTGQNLDEVVELLCGGNIVSWFHGGSELGPRSLGQRSILCDPRGPDMKDRLNSRVKLREAFRPFAPAVLLEYVDDWFDVSPGFESPFMLRVVPFKEEKKSEVPAVVHYDGTGRIQTLTKKVNGRFYDLVRRFYEKTGVPILLNTSFNVAGEPIVETPEDALSCFVLTDINYCVFDSYLLGKDPLNTSPLDFLISLTVDRIVIDHHLSVWRQQNEEPQLHNVPRFFYSVHLDRVGDVERHLLNYRGNCLRLVARKPWGSVLHLTDISLLEVLKRIDGTRNGWQILESLRREVDRKYTSAQFIKVLATLKRASVIRFHCADQTVA